MKRKGVLTCPRCKISSLTVIVNGAPRCDGCGRNAFDLPSWDIPRPDDKLDSPYYGRADLRALMPAPKNTELVAALVAEDEAKRATVKAEIQNYEYFKTGRS